MHPVNIRARVVIASLGAYHCLSVLTRALLAIPDSTPTLSCAQSLFLPDKSNSKSCRRRGLPSFGNYSRMTYL